MIRILVLIDTNVGGRGGAEQHLKTIVTNLDAGDFSVDIVQLAVTVPHQQGRIGVATYRHLPIANPTSLKGLQQIFAIYRQMKLGKYDCVISYFETSDLISSIVAPLAGIKTRISSRRDTGFRLSNRMRLIYRFIDRRFTKIIAASNAIANTVQLPVRNNKKLEVIYNGVNLKRFSVPEDNSIRETLGIKASETALGVVANLSPVKNHQLTLKCVRMLHDENRLVHLLLAGDGPLRDELERTAAELGISSYVHFLGRRQDIVAILSAIDVFVMASKTEGMSNAILEAMAAGKPVVATNVGGNPEAVVDGLTGYLVPNNDLMAMRDRLVELIDNRDLRIRMGILGKQRISERFSMPVMISNYVTVIRDALRENRKYIETDIDIAS